MTNWTLDLLKSKCEIDGDCWLWSHSCQSKGYPQAHIFGKLVLVQRFTYTDLMERRLPKGWVVSPSCGNRTCCSPKHIQGKSRGQILRKAYADGRRVKSLEMLRNRQRAIERGLNTRLDMGKARDLRARRSEGAAALAAEYDINLDTVYRVWANRAWREHINGASVFNWTP